MNRTVVDVFESEGFVVRIVNFFCCLPQFKGLAEQGVEGGIQLAERCVFQGMRGHLGEDRFAAFQHFCVQVEIKTVVVSPLSFTVIAPEIGFAFAPVFEGSDGDIERLADVSQIAIELVDLIEGVDFGIEMVAAGHYTLFLMWLVDERLGCVPRAGFFGQPETRIARLFYGVVNIWSRVGMTLTPRVFFPSPQTPLPKWERGFVALGGIGVWVGVGGHYYEEMPAKL